MELIYGKKWSRESEKISDTMLKYYQFPMTPENLKKREELQELYGADLGGMKSRHSVIAPFPHDSQASTASLLLAHAKLKKVRILNQGDDENQDLLGQDDALVDGMHGARSSGRLTS